MINTFQCYNVKRQRKIIFFAIFLFLFLPVTLNAKVFEFSASAGMRNTTVKEFVYQDDYTLSRLDWNADLIPILNANARFDFFNIVTDLSLLAGLPVKIGSMQDYDWNGTDKSKVTDFSTHDLEVNYLFEAELKTGYNFNILSSNVPVKLKLLPQAGFLFRVQKFEGMDGYGQYASKNNVTYWNESLKKTEFSGSVITYEQFYYLPFISLEANCVPISFLNLKLYGRFYPLAIAEAFDSHLQRNTIFDDYMNNGIGFSAGTEVCFKNFALSFCYEWLKWDTGKTLSGIIDSGNYYTENTTPGLSSSTFSLMLSYKF